MKVKDEFLQLSHFWVGDGQSTWF
ncbi:hypothetical protein Zm00014a_001820 [Zea mays]|uniref:Uncharacterized protein n=1 Tax=Zea mays TaxID=4577 RepID=A0A3L6E6Q1_MAIZE|nr:hypothetical protein Zm00014a_001820 [Zea mays]